MKKLLFTQATGHITYDAITIPRMERYARLHDYDFHVMRGKGHNGVACWERIKFLQSLEGRQNHDAYLYVDADVFIVPLAPDIAMFREMRRTHEVLWVSEKWCTGEKLEQKRNEINEVYAKEIDPLPADGFTYHNAGVFYYRGDLREIGMRADLPHCSHFDQDYLNFHFQARGVPVTTLQSKFNEVDGGDGWFHHCAFVGRPRLIELANKYPPSAYGMF